MIEKFPIRKYATSDLMQELIYKLSESKCFD